MVTVNIFCARGDTAKWTFYAKKDNAPVDLTGAHILFAVRRNFATEPIFERTSDAGGGITITSTAEGVAEIKLRSADTLQLPNDSRDLDYTIHVHTAAGDQWCMVGGVLTVGPIAAANADLS